MISDELMNILLYGETEIERLKRLVNNLVVHFKEISQNLSQIRAELKKHDIIFHAKKNRK